MPLTGDDRALIRRLYGSFDPNKPVEPGHHFYEPIYTEGADLGVEDPVEQIASRIELDGVESIRLFSGFRGSGKTTELKRLQKRLEGEGYVVLYADALDYVSPTEPLEIGELLIALAGAFGEALRAELGHDVIRESYFTRAWHFLQSDVTLKEAGVKAELGVPGLGRSDVDLKFELKSPTSFRQTIQKALANRLQDVKRHADAFFEDGIKAIRARYGAGTQVAFIFDQLEQLRGVSQTEAIVIRSVERMFASYVDLLRFPYVHAVYTVPPWLSFVLPGTVQVTLLSTVHLWNNDAARTRCEPAWGVFRRLVRRRFNAGEVERVLGPGADTTIDRAIDVCGGHVRDLLRMVQDMLRRALAQSTLPLAARAVEDAVSAAKRDFLPIALDDAKWLAEIARVRATALPNNEPQTVNRLARYLDNHWVLYFVSAQAWYDVHPLIRDEIDVVLQAAAPPTP